MNSRELHQDWILHKLKACPACSVALLSKCSQDTTNTDQLTWLHRHRSSRCGRSEVQWCRRGCREPRSGPDKPTDRHTRGSSRWMGTSGECSLVDIAECQYLTETSSYWHSSKTDSPHPRTLLQKSQPWKHGNESENFFRCHLVFRRANRNSLSPHVSVLVWQLCEEAEDMLSLNRAVTLLHMWFVFLDLCLGS